MERGKDVRKFQSIELMPLLPPILHKGQEVTWSSLLRGYCFSIASKICDEKLQIRKQNEEVDISPRYCEAMAKRLPLGVCGR